MAEAITRDLLEKWLKYTGCSTENPEEYAIERCPQIEGIASEDPKGIDEAYVRFARTLLRSVISQGIHDLSRPNAPTSSYKIACKLDFEIELAGRESKSTDSIRAIVSLGCCGRVGCPRCLHTLDIT
ncbi:MAG: hypothetical protein AAGB04_27810 [Pseudomonadota bacterium]